MASEKNITFDSDPLRYQNRLKFDEKEYQTFIKESTSPLGYYINTLPHVASDACSQPQAGMFISGNMSNVPQNINLVNIENELRGLYRVNSRAPVDKYNPEKSGESVCSDKGTLDANCYPKNDLNMRACDVRIYSFPAKPLDSGLPPLPERS
jgi:hypothetical protein